LLFEIDEELYRAGKFKRIFPLPNNIEQYKPYFEYHRYTCVLLWKYLQNGNNFLEKICKKINSSVV
jgi:hypothetical protein